MLLAEYVLLESYCWGAVHGMGWLLAAGEDAAQPRTGTELLVVMWRWYCRWPGCGGRWSP
jgi:hypothetical protein